MQRRELAILRVDRESGKVKAANNAALELLGGACIGATCASAVRAVRPDGAPICSANCVHQGVTEETLAALVEQGLAEMVCSEVGDEVIVTIRSEAELAVSVDPLTRREVDVMRLVAKGQTTPQIAGALGVSASTVRTHVEHAREKLRATTRAEAVARALAYGLL